MIKMIESSTHKGNEMVHSIFTPASFFLLRAPVRSIMESTSLLSNKKNWIAEVLRLYEDDEWLREAVSVASPNLYNLLQKKEYKDLEQIATSLLNYTLRMGTRSTPFGLFSFVSMGSWGENTQTTIDLKKVWKRTRPDMQWIYSFIQKLYSDDTFFTALTIRANPLAWSNGNRLYLSYRRQVDPKEKNVKQNASITNTKLVKAILEISKEPIGVQVILEKLTAIMPNLDYQKAKSTLKQLLASQFILPGILPSLLNHSPFKDLLAEYSIETINQQIQAYDNLPTGKGEEQLASLKKAMTGIAESKSYLQVDLGYKGSPIQLPSTILEEVKDAVNLLWKLSLLQPRSKMLINYHAKFVEKYGTSRTVPLFEMLNEQKGLGSFENQVVATPKPLNEKAAHYWDSHLKQTWQKCFLDKKQEIFIDDTIVEYCLNLAKDNLVDSEKAILSFDIFCKLFAQSPTDIAQGKFTILLDNTTRQGCSSFGRFFDLFSEEEQSQIYRFYRLEENLQSDSCFVELSYLPSSTRASNVAIHPCFRKYRLDIETKHHDADTLSLNDIYVGATHDRFYLTFKDGGAEIETSVSNLLTLTNAPLPLQFMREVTLHKRQPLIPFFWGAFSDMANFLPRVCYRKTILSPAQWKIDGVLFSKEKPEKISASFNAWADQWQLPKLSYLVQDDLHLLIDREHPAHLREISQRLQKGESLLFFEKIDQTWLKSEKGYHASEFIIPFIKNPAQTSQNSTFQPPAYTSVPLESRLKIPGSEWLYLKFYLAEEEINRFLLQHLVPFTEELRQEEVIGSWFFVRYKDPDSHLRFRIHLDSEDAFTSVMPLFKQMAIQWLESGLIRSMVLETYEREIERYGGPELIDAAENIFCADSLAASYLLHAATAFPQLTAHEIVFHTLSVIHFLNDLELSREAMLNLLTYDQKELKGYREYKTQLIHLAGAIENHAEMPIVDMFNKASQLRLGAIRAFSDQPNTQLHLVYGSLLHMHCNRIGCMGNAEKQAMAFAHHTLKQLDHKFSLSEGSCILD